MADEPERPDNPNQSVVRPDGSGPADVGDGAGKAPKKAAEKPAAKPAAAKSTAKGNAPADDGNGG